MNSYKTDASRRRTRVSKGAGRQTGSARNAAAGGRWNYTDLRQVLRDHLTLACFAFVAICMAFGGGPGAVGLSFAMIALSGVILLVVAVRGSGARAFQALPLIVRLAVALAVALPFVQLIPLPPSVWQALPGHGLRVTVLKAFGQGAAWLPLSITPAETAYSGVIALSMLGLFIAVLALPQDRLRKLLNLVLGMIGIGTVFGIIQYSSGGTFFRFYDVSHRDALIGLFANKNHMGLTLACVVPLSVVLFERQLDSNRGAFVLLGIGWVALIALIIATNSRAGVLLALLAMLLAGLRLFPLHRQHVVLAAACAAASTVVIASFVPVVGAILERFGQSGDDVRFNILSRGVPLVEQYGILGSGLGSFAAVYAPTEKLEWVNPFYLNHLHNDWLQLIIEAGIPGVAIMVLILAALAIAARKIWGLPPAARNRSASREEDKRSLAWAGMVIIVMFALHSFGDYPARRVGTLVLVVIGFAMVIRPCLSPAATAPVIDGSSHQS